MIFELTRDYTIIVPLMISNTIAYFISQKLQHDTVYEALAQQDGVHLPKHSHGKSEAANVTAAMREVPLTLAAETDVESAMARTSDSGLDTWPVVSAAHGFQGMATRAELAEALRAGRGAELLESVICGSGADNPSVEELPHVHPDHSLHLALERMGASGLTVLPVVSRASARHLLGIVVLEDVMKAYGLNSEKSNG
jgi:CIC family chloride channel protein